MPNWCRSDITIWNNDLKVIRRIIDAFERGALLDEFIPCPKELYAVKGDEPPEYAQAMIEKHGAADRYDWRVKHWGTTCDVEAIRDNTLRIVSPTKIKLSILTAWNPPLPVLDHWVDLGCHVRGRLRERTSGYKGSYKDKWRIQNDPWENAPSSLLSEIWNRHGITASVAELDLEREYLTNWHLQPLSSLHPFTKSN